MNPEHATGERRLLGGEQGAACVGPAGSWLYPGAGLEVGVQHLGQESMGHHVFLAVCCAVP